MNDNNNPWSSLGFQTLVILNRLRNERELLELSEEAAPTEKNSKEQRANEHAATIPVGIFSWDAMQNPCAQHLERYQGSYNPLRNAHSDRPDDREEKSANGKETPDDPKETKSDPKADREYIERRLRDIAEFERRYHDGAVGALAVRPCVGKKRCPG